MTPERAGMLDWAEMSDPHGYDRLARALDFVAIEVRSAGLDPSNIETARRFYGSGSPSEFLGESLVALETLVLDGAELPSSVLAFVQAVIAEIRQGFDRVGGG
jgi:hypothetical protein